MVTELDDAFLHSPLLLLIVSIRIDQPVVVLPGILFVEGSDGSIEGLTEPGTEIRVTKGNIQRRTFCNDMTVTVPFLTIVGSAVVSSGPFFTDVHGRFARDRERRHDSTPFKDAAKTQLLLHQV